MLGLYGRLGNQGIDADDIARPDLQTALKEAMRAKEVDRLSTLRLINAAIKDREIAARGEPDGGTVGEAEILAIMARMVKQRQESVRAYEEGGGWSWRKRNWTKSR